MEVEQPRKWLAILVLLVMSQLPDLILPLEFFDDEDKPFWALYSFNLGIDATVAAFIFRGLFAGRDVPDYAEAIGWCFIMSCVLHQVFFMNEFVDNEVPHAVFIKFDELFYLNSLEFIVYMQWLALFWGGYGLYDRTAANDEWGDVPGKPLASTMGNTRRTQHQEKQESRESR